MVNVIVFSKMAENSAKNEIYSLFFQTVQVAKIRQKRKTH
jgi:hypothetical protein